MHSKILGLIAHLLCAGAAPAAELPWEALPQAPDEDAALEAVIVVRDLRAVHAWSQHVRGVLREVPVGEALTSGEGPGVWGLDLWHDVAHWLALAAPGNEPVPAGLAIMSTSSDLGWQGILQATPDVANRLLQEHAEPLAQDGNVWKLPRGDRTLFVQVDGQGWLRVSPDRHWLSAGLGTVAPVMRKAASGSAGYDVALLVLGQGSLARRLLRLSQNPATQTMGENVRSAGVAWRLGDPQTTQLRLLLDAPMLETLAPLLRKRELVDPFTHSLGHDMQGLAVLAVPPPLVKAFPNWADTHLGGTNVALPAGVHGLLEHVEGHLAFVSYDAPGDWALAAQFDSDETAASMVPLLQSWAQQVLAALAPAGQQVLSLDTFPGAAEKVLHLRPEAHLEGPYVAARGANLLFVQQRSRLERLLAEGKGAPSEAEPQGLFKEPMTPLMRESFATSHMLSAYKVLGSDAAWLDYVVWAAGRLQSAAQSEHTLHPEDVAVTSLLERLPQWVGALSYLWLCTYDVGLSADVLGPLLVIDVTHSEI